MQKTTPSKIDRTGFKYWLAPDGTLFQTLEHSQGAKMLADTFLSALELKRIGIDPDRIPINFGLTELFQLGWLRLNTLSAVIGVTGGENGTPYPTELQKAVLLEMRDKFEAISDSVTQVLMGEGPDPEGRQAIDLGSGN